MQTTFLKAVFSDQYPVLCPPASLDSELAGEVQGSIISIEGVRYAKTSEGLYVIHDFGTGPNARPVVKFNNLLYKVVPRSDYDVLDSKTVAKMASLLKNASIKEEAPEAVSAATEAASSAPASKPAQASSSINDNTPTSELVDRYLRLLDQVDKAVKGLGKSDKDVVSKKTDLQKQIETLRAQALNPPKNSSGGGGKKK